MAKSESVPVRGGGGGGGGRSRGEHPVPPPVSIRLRRPGGRPQELQHSGSAPEGPEARGGPGTGGEGEDDIIRPVVVFVTVCEGWHRVLCGF